MLDIIGSWEDNVIIFCLCNAARRHRLCSPGVEGNPDLLGCLRMYDYLMNLAARSAGFENFRLFA